jgi:hypothetical protein
MVFNSTKPKKVAVEKLQEEHLTGPAQEPMEQIQAEMGETSVKPVTHVPRMEKIIFRNQRDPGHVLEFHFASKNVPFTMFKLIDGQEYTLPMEVIRNLEGCRENIEKYRRNSQGIPEIYIAGYKTHFVCERT